MTPLEMLRSALVIECVALLYIMFSYAGGAAADSHPTPSPPPFRWTGTIRSYYFVRLNANTCLESGCKPKGTPDSQAFNSGLQLHGEYTFRNTPFVLGATYFGAEPFNANPFGVLGVGYNPRVDNTLPGYGISTLAEMYAEYKTSGLTIQTGKEIINTPWANAADSRIVPVAYQGTVIEANLTPLFRIGGMYITRFKSRITSAFNANTMLTSCNTAYPTGKGQIAGVPGTFTVEGDQCNLVQKSAGFWLLDAAYENRALTANAYYYHVFDLVNLAYGDVKFNYDRSAPADPFVAAQFWWDNNTGSALVGMVHSYGYGLQYGLNLGKRVTFVLSSDDQPAKAYVVPAAQCPGSASSGTKPGPGVVFGGVQNASVTGLPAGDVLCYGGGTASPYTDNYESDPLYTSSIGEGITDARKAGFAAKAALTFQTANRRLKLLLSQARYNVSLPGTSDGASNTDIRTETNLDVQYFFNTVDPKQRYRGFSFRERLVDRVETFTPFDFKYIRTQLQYDF